MDMDLNLSIDKSIRYGWSQAILNPCNNISNNNESKNHKGVIN